MYLPDNDTMAENIIKYYNLALEFELEQGSTWYAEARRMCAVWANELKVDLETFALIVAATSPRMPWNRNIKAAIDVISWWQAGADLDEIKENVATIGANVKRAWQILTGVDLVECFRGPKIRSFYSNIVDPEYPGATIDTWAYRVAVDKPHCKPVTINDIDYRTIEIAYQTAAEQLGISTHELQAVTWVVIRRRARWPRDFQAAQLTFFGGVA